MINPNPPKASITLSSLRLISLAASFIFIAANSAQAEEILYPERRVYAEQRVYPAQNPVQQGYPQQQAEFDPLQHGPGKKAGWNFTVGLGTMYKPAFTGSKDYQAMAFPDIKVEYDDVFFASLFEGVGYNVINSDGWRAGPIIKFDFGRTEEDDNPFLISGDETNALRGLGDVDATAELGGFVEYNVEPFSATIELRQGVGGHEGLVGETSLNYMGFTEQLFKSMGVFGGYDRLSSEVADSPLIKERGDENQFMGGLRITYEFGY